jgi:6-phosphogluconolactonase (cycloisomerase 2 family)
VDGGNSPEPAPLFAYVGCRTTKERGARGEGINVYRVDTISGKWTHVQLVKDLVNPSFLAFDRKHNFLYSVHGDFSEVSAFLVDKPTGTLSFLNRQSTLGKNPVHLAVDPTNRFLIVGNYETGTIAVLPINKDGSLKPPCNLAAVPSAAEPNKVYLPRQGTSHPHHVPFDRSGNYIVVPDLGLDKVFVFRLDASSGKLVPNDHPFVNSRNGAGPRHIDFHPFNPYAYVVNELDSTVTAYRFDASQGKLNALQVISCLPAAFTDSKDFARGFGAAEIVVAPSGKFLYVSNRGDSSIAVFSIDEAAGTLSPAAWASSNGEGPRFIGLDPYGIFLCAANERSDTIVVFRIDTITGKLKSTGDVIHTGSPVCIIFSCG